MRCPNCNTENENSAIFCTHCGSWVLAEVNPNDPTAPLQAEIETTPPAAKSKRKWLWTIPAAAVLLTVLLFIFLPHRNKPTPLPDPVIEGYVYMDYHTEFRYQGFTVQVLYEDQLVHTFANTHLSSGSVGSAVSQDGSVGVFQHGSLLYLFQHGQISILSREVLDFSLSATGNAIAYSTAEGLFLYELLTQETTHISDAPSVSSLLLSPNGKSLLYYQLTSPGNTSSNGLLLCWTQGETTALCQLNTFPMLLGVPDSGKYCYVEYMLEGSAQYSLFTISAGGQTTLLKENVHDLFSSYIASEQNTYLSADCTQLLYYRNGSTYLSVQGQPGNRIGNNVLTPVMPDGAAITARGRNSILPQYDLRTGFYKTEPIYTTAPTTAQGSNNRFSDLYFLEEDGTCTPVLSRGTEMQISRDGAAAIGLDSSKTLHCSILSESDGQWSNWDLPMTVTAFAIGAEFLFLSAGDRLFSVPLHVASYTPPALLATGICFTDLAVNRGDCLFCLHEGREYTLTQLGEMGVTVLPIAQSLKQTPSHLVYITENDTVYVSIDRQNDWKPLI